MLSETPDVAESFWRAEEIRERKRNGGNDCSFKRRKIRRRNKEKKLLRWRTEKVTQFISFNVDAGKCGYVRIFGWRSNDCFEAVGKGNSNGCCYWDIWTRGEKGGRPLGKEDGEDRSREYKSKSTITWPDLKGLIWQKCINTRKNAAVGL